MCCRSEKASCGLCGKVVDIEKYRLHVKTCGHESDEEPQTSLKECPFCHKKVQDLARHCETCSAGNGHSSPDLSARVSCSFLIRRNRLFLKLHLGWTTIERYQINKKSGQRMSNMLSDDRCV